MRGRFRERVQLPLKQEARGGGDEFAIIDREERIEKAYDRDEGCRVSDGSEGVLLTKVFQEFGESRTVGQVTVFFFCKDGE